MAINLNTSFRTNTWCTVNPTNVPPICNCKYIKCYADLILNISWICMQRDLAYWAAIHCGPTPLPTFFPLCPGTPIKNLLVHALTALDSHSHQATPDVSSQPSTERLPWEATPTAAAHLTTTACEWLWEYSGQQSGRSSVSQSTAAQCPKCSVETLSFVLLRLLFLCLFFIPFVSFQELTFHWTQGVVWERRGRRQQEKMQRMAWQYMWMGIDVCVSAAVVGLVATGYKKCGLAPLTQKVIGLLG